ncbi:MAG: phosphatase PAP2 family protein [Bacteroidia bacterium]|nr:phosphatase PAP2 family protein [Bacteroidia bacterium]
MNLKTKIILFIQLLLCYHILWGQSIKKTLARQFIIPVVIVGYGLTTFYGNGYPSSYDVKNYRDQHFANFKTQVDDILPVAPVALTYGLDLLGIKCKSDFTNRSVIFAKAALLSITCVNIMKYTSNVMRPDSTALNSFPSGHTAFTFAMATVMHQELKSRSIWWSVLGFSCATGVGALRILNNRHWFTDVIVGAGIGIASGQIASATHQYKWNRYLLRAQIIPVFFNNGYGIAFNKKF